LELEKCSGRTLVVDDIPEGEVGAEAAVAPLDADADEAGGFSEGVLVGARDAQHRAHVEFGHVDLRAPPHHVRALQFLAHKVAELEVGVGQELRVHEPVVLRHHHPVTFFILLRRRLQRRRPPTPAADLPSALLPKFA